MAESNDVQAIERISAVVGESQIKIILSNQCIKAQTFLVNRLKKQFQNQKEISKFISTDNLKLEAEIQNAEQEIKSLMLAHESIKSANVELKKEWLVAKERAQETVERIRSGEKKYDDLWEQCKSRYESIQFVQNWLQAKKTAEDFTENIRELERETRGLLKDIESKQNMVAGLNKKRIIELAEYVMREKPETVENIKRINLEIKDLNNQLEKLQQIQSEPSNDLHNADFSVGIQQATVDSQNNCNSNIDKNWPNLNKNFNNNRDEMMPKLHLMSIDLDMLSVKLDQIKKSDVVATSPRKNISQTNAAIGGVKPIHVMKAVDKKHEEYLSCYFTKCAGESEENKCNYSTRKLINILEDVKVDKTEAIGLLSKVDFDNIHEVYNITTNADKEDNSKFVNENIGAHSECTKNGAQDEMEITLSHGEHVLMPPSGFLDQIRDSQENKKKVSFELPTTMQDLVMNPEFTKESNDDKAEADEANVTVTSALEISSASNESFSKIKDMILKKHNLDLSPQFVYAKNTVLQKNEEMDVTSNYFKRGNEEFKSSLLGATYEKEQTKITEIMEVDENELDSVKPTQSNEFGKDESLELKIGEDKASNIQTNPEQNRGNQVSGLLFKHGAQGLPESLDVSISTTGFEDGEADFPQYSSLLLSPKADMPMPSTSGNCDVTSQEVPNFLSGLRKTGLSIFGKIPGAVPSDADTAEVGGNNFNFTFGTERDDKKSRGGIFNMFN